MESRVTEIEVTTRFGDFVDRVSRSGESFIVERDGKPVMRLEPVRPRGATLADLEAYFSRNLPPDPEFARDVQDVIDSQRVGIPETRWD